jgi:aerobic C4-dicarboxylate transport protein
MTLATGLSLSTEALQPRKPFWRGLGFQIIIATALGIAVGILFPPVAVEFKILGDIFLRLIKTAVVPLVFLCIANGIVSAGDLKPVGKVGLVAMQYFEVASTLALGVGMLGGSILGVGRGMSAGALAASVKPPSAAVGPHPTLDFILNVFPDNFVGAFARGELLQVLVIGLIMGAALLRMRAERRAPIERGLNIATDALFEFIYIIMSFAPLGTFGAVAFAIASSGAAVLLSLSYLVLGFCAVAVVFVVAVLGTICALFRINLFRLILYIKEELYIVLGTASSESVLPRLLEKLPQFGCSRQTVGLVLPTGYAFNTTARRSWRSAWSSSSTPTTCRSAFGSSLAFSA